ncbi:MAG: serine/threonine protein kinase [Labilithrix sp.]|nr:serine/threonine protein kinase [Labilithrix sp.]
MSEIRFGGYRVEGTIGSGALATIFKAVQEPLGRVVALKALNTQIAPTSSFGEQLDREAKILADLAHPNVVLLLEASRTASGRPYVVLEWVDGPSLEDVLAVTTKDATSRRARDKAAARTKLGVPAALAVACGICSALEHVHERGVVHRDVKPSNVLLSRTGHVKLIDFGIAQRPRTASMSDTLGTEGITPSGRMAPEQIKDAFGTPAYMSPEQILGDFVDGRSDLFSLGVVLYQMLSGSRPFETPGADDSKRSAAQRIRRDAPAPLRERAPHCPRAVERIVMRLLEKSPNDRYPSAGVVKERLEAALRAETREDPAALLRQALVDCGLGAKDDARDARRDQESRPIGRAPLARPGSSPRITARRPIGLGRALAGFALVTSLFTVAVVANEGVDTQAREARSAGSRTLELAPDRAGGLRVVATPWAHVRVDGQLVETTPFARAIPLGAGRHFVTLTHPDAPSAVEREVDIVAGEIVTLDVTMNVSAEDAGKDAP